MLVRPEEVQSWMVREYLRRSVTAEYQANCVLMRYMTHCIENISPHMSTRCGHFSR